MTLYRATGRVLDIDAHPARVRTHALVVGGREAQRHRDRSGAATGHVGGLVGRVDRTAAGQRDEFRALLTYPRQRARGGLTAGRAAGADATVSQTVRELLTLDRGRLTGLDVVHDHRGRVPASELLRGRDQIDQLILRLDHAIDNGRRLILL